jgi:hypothetical protein
MTRSTPCLSPIDHGDGDDQPAAAIISALRGTQQRGAHLARVEPGVVVVCSVRLPCTASGVACWCVWGNFASLRPPEPGRPGSYLLLKVHDRRVALELLGHVPVATYRHQCAGP